MTQSVECNPHRHVAGSYSQSAYRYCGCDLRWTASMSSKQTSSAVRTVSLQMSLFCAYGCQWLCSRPTARGTDQKVNLL